MKLSATLLCAICLTGVSALEGGKLIDGVFTAYDDIFQLGSITSVDKRSFLFPNLNSLIVRLCVCFALCLPTDTVIWPA